MSFKPVVGNFFIVSDIIAIQMRHYVAGNYNRFLSIDDIQSDDMVLYYCEHSDDEIVVGKPITNLVNKKYIDSNDLSYFKTKRTTFILPPPITMKNCVVELSLFDEIYKKNHSHKKGDSVLWGDKIVLSDSEQKIFESLIKTSKS